MVIVMFKSRFTKIGIDQTSQFEPFYMKEMVEKIAKAIDFDFLQERRSYKRNRAFWTKKVRIIDVIGITLKIKLSEEQYDQLFKCAALGEKVSVSEQEASQWI
jgi:lipopolysaccharide biosynthesis protein